MLRPSSAPIYDFLNESPSRVPMTDWYRTIQGTQVGFKARSVVGGVFMPVLNDKAIWKKWAARDLAAAKNVNFNWAPLPPPRVITTVVPTSEKGGVMWQYTTSKPAGNWFAPDYDATRIGKLAKAVWARRGLRARQFARAGTPPTSGRAANSRSRRSNSPTARIATAALPRRKHRDLYQRRARAELGRRQCFV